MMAGGVCAKYNSPEIDGGVKIRMVAGGVSTVYCYQDVVGGVCICHYNLDSDRRYLYSLLES